MDDVLVVGVGDRVGHPVSLAGLVLFGGLMSFVVLVGSVRMPTLEAVEQIINYWDDRWSRRVEYAESLVNAKDYSHALEYLVALDRDFPAQHVRHKRDRERERLLRALGHTYSELDKKRLTLETYQRLAEFDPRNVENFYLLAVACLKFNETELAEKHFGEVLKIHPTHLPSVRALLKIYFDRAGFAQVIAAHDAYLNAFLMQPVKVALGQSSTAVNVPVDGRFHDIEVRATHLPGTAGELAIHVGQFAVEIKQVTLERPVLVGRAGVQPAALWPGETSLRVQEMAPIKKGRYRALGSGATLRLDVPAQPEGVAAVHLTLRLFKPLDADLWSMVEKSYKNLLRYDALEAARERWVNGIPAGEDL
jgi:hypothetical protein